MNIHVWSGLYAVFGLPGLSDGSEFHAAHRTRNLRAVESPEAAGMLGKESEER